VGEIIYKDLSFKLIGIAYKIDNQLGFGHTEKVYSDAFEELLSKENISFKRELYYPIKIDDKVICKKFLDFLVEDKIVVEVKTGNYRYRDVFNQVFEYLKINSVKLGLIVRFSRDGVQVRRVVNLK